MARRFSKIQVALLLAVSSSAFAAERDELTDSGAPTGSPPSPAPLPSGQISADNHFAEGVRLYALGRFAEARVEFAHAYRKNPLPDLLHNQSMAAENSGDIRGALALEEDYLRRITDTTQREEAQTRCSVLRAMLSREELYKPAVPLAVGTSPAKPSYAGALVCLGVGAALGIAGSATLAYGAVLTERARQPTYPEDYAGIVSAGRSANIASIVLLTIGGAAVGAGAVWAGVVRAKRGR